MMIHGACLCGAVSYEANVDQGTLAGTVRERESLAAACYGNCAAVVSQRYSGPASSAGGSVDRLSAYKGALGEPDMD